MRDFHQSGRSPVYSVNGMAATSMPIASLTAIEVLRAGGNAVDAAVAACAVLAVVEPQSTGLGGDCFCLYAPPEAARSSPSMVRAGRRERLRSTRSGLRVATPPDDISPHGVTIPGAVSGWQSLLDAHGTKGFDELLLPAIRCAEEGFPVHQRVAWDWSMFESKLRRAGATSSCRTAARRAKAIASSSRRLLARCAPSPSTARRPSTLARLPPTWRRRFERDGGVQTEEDFANGLQCARVRRADLDPTGAGSTSGSARPTGRVWSRS